MPAWLPGTDVERCRFILLRHGQTPCSVEGKYAGRADIPLTEEGKRQGEKAGRWLQGWDIDAAVCSPARRCQETLQAANLKSDLPVRTEENLIEMDFGQWDLKTFAQVRKNWPSLHQQWFDDWSVRAPDGESIQAVDQRVSAAFTSIAEDNWGKTVLVVSHVTPIKAILRHALDASPSLFTRLHLDTASISVVDMYNDGPVSVQLINSTAHLEGEL